jgi:bifunctional non-homologous end joining protein LigD
LISPSIREARKLPHFIKPMLAKDTDRPFNDANWIFEIKWDGYRAISEIDKENVKLYSRNGLNFEYSYPIVVEELKKIKEKVVLDGEVVVLNDEGLPEFQLLQHYDSNRHRPIQYYVFDILSHNGKDTTHLPLIKRKELVKKLLKKSEVIKYSDHIEAKGIDFFKLTEKQNLEGIMAKKADSQYHIGKRTSEWLKIKHHKTLEAIIAGFTEPTGGRKYFGALVLGMMDDGKLKYVGHSGSGFNYQSLKEMYELLKPLIQDKSPFDERVKTNMPVTWVEPKLVCEVKFSEITRDKKLRHPIFLHLREDKNPQEVTMNGSKPVKKQVAEKEAEEESTEEKLFTYGKNKVKTTNLTKVLFPDEGITKGDVINYYRSVAKYILPYLKGRPESLYRTPNGINEQGFFQKDIANSAPAYATTQLVYSESNKKEINYILCDNEATLTYLNNLGCIELNPWHSTIKKLDYPDYLMLDIDPSDKNTFEQVIEAANAVKEILDIAGAPAFCKTSGASGIHIYVPTAKRYTYEQVKDFAYIVCMMASDLIPDFTTLERNLQKRGKDKIYMDYLQNRKGQTIASVYSLRPKPGATASCPLEWKEVKKGLSPQQFHINNMLNRIQKKGDLFKDVLGKGIDLNKCLKKLGA